MKFVKEQQNPVKVKQRFSLRKLKIGTVSVMLAYNTP
ncbi:YSIRK-type signal peptide-containing protein [Limosilactobacillus portuensis]